MTVLPVIDCEPPPRTRPSRSPASASPIRRRGRPPRPDRAAATTPPSSMRTAAAFADAALRRVLEVIDRRRPGAQLYPLLLAGLADSVLAARPASRTDAAALQRLRLQPAGPDDPATAAEVFGTYRRGERIHALACRVEQTAAAGAGWRIVALHIG